MIKWLHPAKKLAESQSGGTIPIQNALNKTSSIIYSTSDMNWQQYEIGHFRMLATGIYIYDSYAAKKGEPLWSSVKCYYCTYNLTMNIITITDYPITLSKGGKCPSIHHP